MSPRLREADVEHPRAELCTPLMLLVHGIRMCLLCAAEHLRAVFLPLGRAAAAWDVEQVPMLVLQEMPSAQT